MRTLRLLTVFGLTLAISDTAYSQNATVSAPQTQTQRKSGEQGQAKGPHVETKAPAQKKPHAPAPATAQVPRQTAAEAEVPTQPSAEAEVRAQASAEAEPAVRAPAEADALAQASAEAEALTQDQAETEVLAAAEAIAKAEAEAKARVQARTRARAQAKAQALARVQAEAVARVQAEAQARAQVDARARAKAQAKGQARTQAELQARAEANAQARTKSQAESQARVQAQAEARAQAQAEAQVQAETQAQIEAQAQAEALARARSRAQAQAEAKAQAKAEAEAQDPNWEATRKLDDELRHRAVDLPTGRTRVIVEMQSGWDASNEIKALGGRLGRRLLTFNGRVAELPNAQLKALAARPGVTSIHYDRPVVTSNNRTAVAIGARTARLAYGYTGAGVGVAVIDSGVSSWHDDLSATGTAAYPYGHQRVAAFVDFVNRQPEPYDDNGHGTHVAGTIAGSGYDSYGYKAGMAPGAHVVVLKVLDADGQGSISNIIAALDYAVAHKSAYNIRVINMSIGAGIYESYETDPLTLAAKRAVDAGIVVVAAAGNMGRKGYGSITAPGNAPWVLTIGASSTNGTVNRTDDEIAPYSSRGPTYIDYLSKPDLVAPGTGIMSLASTTSKFFSTKASSLRPGYRPTAEPPYLGLSGTSMAAPVVAGSVALMLEANPSLTPNLVKAILQYTAQLYPNYNALTQGAGFLNTMGAVELARNFASAEPGTPYPNSPHWSHHLIWGNHLIGQGVLLPSANAWDDNVVWGSAFDGDGDNVVWGSSGDEDNVVWGSSVDGDNVVWGSSGDEDNVVWGSDCGGADCDNIVWGSSDEEDNIVWGSSNDDDLDNVVWGSSAAEDNVVWGSSAGDDNVVWGSNGDDNIVWASSTGAEHPEWPDDADFRMADPALWGQLFLPSAAAEPDNGNGHEPDSPAVPPTSSELAAAPTPEPAAAPTSEAAPAPTPEPASVPAPEPVAEPAPEPAAAPAPEPAPAASEPAPGESDSAPPATDPVPGASDSAVTVGGGVL